MPRLFGRTAIAVLAAGLTAIPLSMQAQSRATGVRYTANAINMNTGASGPVEIVVTRWSSDGERDRLMKVMLEQGPEKLLDVLQKMPRVGYLRTPDSIGWDIHFARRAPQPDGGERVVILTDRRIGFWEATNRPRTIDYPFTFIELRLKGDTDGEGKLSLATKIIGDKENNLITLENYDIQPVMLKNVKREKT